MSDLCLSEKSRQSNLNAVAAKALVVWMRGVASAAFGALRDMFSSSGIRGNKSSGLGPADFHEDIYVDHMIALLRDLVPVLHHSQRLETNIGHYKEAVKFLTDEETAIKNSFKVRFSFAASCCDVI